MGGCVGQHLASALFLYILKIISKKLLMLAGLPKKQNGEYKTI